jgi:catechol 2,3-dioxygenase-like lactoylglutathione lyase family enzyme
MRFYCAALGFEPAAHYAMDDPALGIVMEVQGAVIHAQMVRNPEGAVLELLQFDRPAPFGSRDRRPGNQYGLTHLAFYVGDIDAVAARIRAAGGQVHEQTRAVFPEGDTTMMYCTDPDGVRIELMHNPAIEARFSHSGICIADIEAAMRFYHEALGFAPAENHALLNHSSWLDIVNELRDVRLRARMVRSAAGDTIELLKMDSPACFGPRARRPMNQLGLTHLAFHVDSIDDAATAVLAHGGRIHPQTRARFESGIEILYATDPDGVRVELMQAP